MSPLKYRATCRYKKLVCDLMTDEQAPPQECFDVNLDYKKKQKNK